MNKINKNPTEQPGAWREMIEDKRPLSEREKDVNLNTQVPLAIQDAIVEDVAKGELATRIAEKYEVTRSYVRAVLIRRFGSVEAMKRALTAQCFENAMALNEYAMEHLDKIAPGQALVGAKILIDGGLALEKSVQDRPATVDFGMLSRLGMVLEKIEKRVEGTTIS